MDMGGVGAQTLPHLTPVHDIVARLLWCFCGVSMCVLAIAAMVGGCVRGVLVLR